MRKSLVPVWGEFDVVVVGGTSSGVAAAAAAARAGARVFLAASETYLGDDICATGRLWLDPNVPLDTPLARDLFADAAGNRVAPVAPMDVKRRLDTELIDAGVRFIFGCHPADLLLDSRGRAAGVVLACKTGRFAVRAPVILDATPFAAVARVAGLPFTPWAGGEVAFRRVVVGHRAEGDDGAVGRLLPGVVRGEHNKQPVELQAFEYTLPLPLADWSPAALAEAEQTARDRTWHRGQTWYADRPAFVPPVALAGVAHEMDAAGVLPLAASATALPGLRVLGPCAAISRAAAERLLTAPVAIAAGARLGGTLAGESRAAPAARRVRAMHETKANAEVREHCTCARFLRESGSSVSAGSGGLSVLAECDVLVVGGGTGGAPAAIAAAREGARVLVLEALHGLGGVGTLGCISIYYHGYRGGFTQQVTAGLRAMAGDEPFDASRWNNEHKAEWFRREIRRAGGQIWFGSVVSGAVVEGRRVRGVVVNTPWGRGVVRAGAVIDATGNSDVAAAAGAACRTVSDSDLAIQGSGLPSRPFKPAYHNTDYTFIEDGDPTDTTRAFVVARRKFTGAFDLAQIPDTRERRQIVGDVTVTPLDVYTGRTWRDSVCLSRSNFDSHGFTVHPIFLVLPPDRVSIDAWLPLRALLPKAIEGLAVTGLALSGQRDVMPVLRMQPDIQNHAYAAGLAAVMAVRNGNGSLRAIDVPALQRRLVTLEIVPQTVMLHDDTRRVPDRALAVAAGGGLQTHAEIAALLSRPREAAALLRERLAAETDAARRMACAKALAVLGDPAGEGPLADAVAAAGAWDEGWNYTGMGQFGRSLSPLDDGIVLLAALRSERARAAVLALAGKLDAQQAFSHFRAVALYAEALGGADAAAVLCDVLQRPGIAGHAWTSLAAELADIPASGVDTRTRNEALRELYLARALFRCGDAGGVGRRTLEAYVRDLRGHFARHAAAVLAES